MSTEAMKLALEALEDISALQNHSDSVDSSDVDKAITTLQEELAQQQEPVAGCVCRWNSEGDRVVTCERHEGWLEVIAEWADRAREAEKKLKVLNTTPPARKPLTGEEMNQIEARWEASMHGSKIAFVVRETEAAHGIKENT